MLALIRGQAITGGTAILPSKEELWVAFSSLCV